jgi:hypothetical protein
MGLSFIQAGFLAAGLAVGLPILIHLLLRQKTRVVPIGSVRFLQQVVREHRRRRRLRQWILLALRMLAVLLLALLFARPYWDESYRRGMETEIVLLIDRSASMGAVDGGGQTALERAAAQAREQLQQIDENTIVHIGLSDAAGVREVPVEELAAAKPSAAATDYGLALSWANDVLAASQRAHRSIVLFTDLQASGLPKAAPPPLAAGVEFRLEDVGEALRRNVAIAAVEPLHTEIHPQTQPTLRVTLKNHGPIAARQIAVKCTVKGPTPTRRASEGEPPSSFTATKTIDLPGQGTATVELPLAIEKDGLYQGEVTISASDALALDNRRFVAFEARHPDRVLLVDGQEGRAIFNSETYYLETALRLRTTEAGGISRSFEPERIVWESGKGFPRLDGYRAIVLANVRRLSDEDGQRLKEFVDGGGSLLIFAGDQVSRQSLAPLAALDLLPGELAAAPVARKHRVSEWNTKHPALACFVDPQQGDMRRVEFQQVLPLAKLAAGSELLWQAGDQIVAAERVIGPGRVIYVGTTADRDWTDLPRTRMYVPLVRQLAAHLTAQLAERSLAVHKLATGQDDQLGIAPDPKAGNEGRWIVTNLDPRESALERITAEQFAETLGIAAAVPDSAAAAALALSLPADSLRADEIWTAVVWVLLIVLAAETLLAGRVHA